MTLSEKFIKLQELIAELKESAAANEIPSIEVLAEKLETHVENMLCP